jgi:ATP-dependent helicase HrpA
LARDVFERNIRTEAEYKAYETEAGRTLFEKGHALTQTALRVVDLNAKIRAELSKLKVRVKPEYLDAVAADLDRLVPKDFLAVYPIARLVRIPRYLEGLMIRLERARVDPEKDRAKSAQIEPYAFELARLDRAPKSASPISEDKRAAVDELRWMLEEFRLSLFAPEIKTAFPISAVRLARKIAEIDALV